MKKLRLRFLVGLDGMDGLGDSACRLPVFFAFPVFPLRFLLLSLGSVAVFREKRGASLNLFVFLIRIGKVRLAVYNLRQEL